MTPYVIATDQRYTYIHYHIDIISISIDQKHIAMRICVYVRVCDNHVRLMCAVILFVFIIFYIKHSCDIIFMSLFSHVFACILYAIYYSVSISIPYLSRRFLFFALFFRSAFPIFSRNLFCSPFPSLHTASLPQISLTSR